MRENWGGTTVTAAKTNPEHQAPADGLAFVLCVCVRTRCVAWVTPHLMDDEAGQKGGGVEHEKGGRQEVSPGCRAAPQRAWTPRLGAAAILEAPCAAWSCKPGVRMSQGGHSYLHK